MISDEDDDRDDDDDKDDDDKDDDNDNKKDDFNRYSNTKSILEKSKLTLWLSKRKKVPQQQKELWGSCTVEIQITVHGKEKLLDLDY